MALTRLGPNQAVNLTSNVTGALPVANGGTALTSGFNNGTWVKLSESNITSDTADVNITGITATYRTHVVLISRLTPASADKRLICKFRNSATGSYATSSYAYATASYMNSNSDSNDYNTSGGQIYTLGAAEGMGDGSAGRYGSSCILYLNDFMDSTNPPSVYGNGVYSKESGFTATNYFGGTYRDTSTTWDAIKFLFNSGDIAEGNFKMYGIVDD